MSGTTRNGRAIKDNSNKHPGEREDWMKGKKIGRRKQVFDPLSRTWRKV